MFRNMIAANKAIFQKFDQYCAARNDPVGNAGLPRWIATTEADRQILINSTLSDHISFTLTRLIARVDHALDSYFCIIGFEYTEATAGLMEADTNAGLLTTLLAELGISPNASTAEIRDIVEGFDKESDASYDGHDPVAVSSLYPPIRVFFGNNIAADETWRLFFQLCIDECRLGESWIDVDFATALQRICELEHLDIPYETLCRSIFDSDRGSMFLALYRCLELLFAYSGTQQIIDAHSLSINWQELATAMEHQLGWYPREEISLEKLLQNAADDDLKAVLNALGENIPEHPEASLHSLAASRIYKMRNALVHYRPAQRRIYFDDVNWNQLCEAIAVVVTHIYSKKQEV